jgi:hypothetical protein
MAHQKERVEMMTGIEEFRDQSRACARTGVAIGSI